MPSESMSSEGNVGSWAVRKRVRRRIASSMFTKPLARPGVSTAGPSPSAANSAGCRSQGFQLLFKCKCSCDSCSTYTSYKMQQRKFCTILMWGQSQCNAVAVTFAYYAALVDVHAYS